MRVVKPALLIHSHCIDREVATTEIVFKTNGWVGMNLESTIARARFALGACKRVFVLGLRVKKNREVFANGLKTCVKKIFGPRSHHQVVAVDPFRAHKRITDCASNTVKAYAGLKACKVGVGPVGCEKTMGPLPALFRTAGAFVTQNGCSL